MAISIATSSDKHISIMWKGLFPHSSLCLMNWRHHPLAARCALINQLCGACQIDVLTCWNSSLIFTYSYIISKTMSSLVSTEVSFLAILQTNVNKKWQTDCSLLIRHFVPGLKLSQQLQLPPHHACWHHNASHIIGESWYCQSIWMLRWWINKNHMVVGQEPPYPWLWPHPITRIVELLGSSSLTSDGWHWPKWTHTHVDLIYVRKYVCRYVCM